MSPLIVAIDGPSGVGKSTTSRMLAHALSVPHIDTGAMYRAIAVKALHASVALDDEAELERIAASSLIEFVRSGEGVRVLLDKVDVTDAIRAPEVSMAASTVSAMPAVRRLLVKLQQELGKREGGVLEGRDIGTKVFPETAHKFFLTASPDVRASRRTRELRARGIEQRLEEVRAEIVQRDEQDSTRADSPLLVDDSYFVLDTSDLSIDEVVERMLARISHSPSP
ncbi:MAG TPA: (d)CMP kinase [Thermoanaerobaculia bacterium]|nr:(d)CMP kinase [Thermoanaerobaculia bacterium]